jgi:alkanesulfonate monooxygenase SsuD/methylene tetrahydromethanopterin reductase-like flavin-dependent oxidoreductase (luciferase family)
MHVGYSAFFQNLSGRHTDEEVYRHELALADLAEPLGFDSVWSPEHHFTNYIMVPNPAQFLTWVAARTERVQLGAMINVLPWHDPVRLCEEWSVLDQVSGGRAILGLGRGLGRVEFDGFGLRMADSRGQFTEYTAAIVDALETGYIECDGEHLHQSRAAIRPYPNRSFRGRTYASAVSPASIDLMAQLGIGLLIIAQKPWPTTVAEIEGYRERYLELNGEPPPPPIIAVFVAVNEDRSRAEEMFEQYVMAYAQSSVDHYQFDDSTIADIPGYEYYAGISSNIAKHGRDTFARFLAELQVWGTPDEVADQLIDYQRMVGAGGIIGVFSYGGMPFDEAEENMRLFSEKVMPRLKAHEIEGGVGNGSAPTAVAAALSTTHVSW